MKNLVLLALALFVFTLSVNAQFNGKPQYDVLVRQYPDTFGTYRMELFPTIAPQHSVNFDTLAQQGFYDSLAFHRVVPNFVVQGGDPNSKNGPKSTWGQGASWQQSVQAEFNPISHDRSIIGAARAANINSATSQFYINTATNTNLNGQYTAYGKVISGMNVVDSIEDAPRDGNDNPLEKIDMFIQYVGVDTTSPAQAPNLVSPADGAVDIHGNESFSWSSVTTGDFLLYRIQFSKQSDFSTIAYQTDERPNKTSIQPMQNLEQGYQTYYWRAMTNNGGKLKSSTVRSFTTYIDAPMLLSPLDMSTSVLRNPALVWDSVTGATEYNVVVSTIPLLIAPNQKVVDTITPYTAVNIPVLGINKAYYWGVRASVNGVPGEFSGIWIFSTGLGITKIEDDISNKSVILFPNPSKGKVTFYSVNGNINSNLKIFNLNGKLMFESSDISNEGEIDLSNLSSGLYIYSITQGAESIRGKLKIE